MQNSTASSLASAVYSLYVLYMAFEGQNSICFLWIVYQTIKDNSMALFSNWIAPGNRSWDLKKPPTYWASAMTDEIQLTNSKKVLSLET